MTLAQLVTTQPDLTWLPSLIAGLIGAVIGAGVALFVLHRALRHQREQNIRATTPDRRAQNEQLLCDIAEIVRDQGLDGWRTLDIDTQLAVRGDSFGVKGVA